MEYLIFIIILISTKIYNLYFINAKFSFDELNVTISLIFIVVILFKQSGQQNKFKRVKSFIWTYSLAVILSFFVAYYDWSQGFITSIIATRFIWWLSLGFFLINFQISYNQIYKALKFFTIGYMILVYLSYLSPSLEQMFKTPSEKVEELDKGELFLGVEFMVMFFYIQFAKLFENQKLKIIDIIFIIAIFFAIILTDNRSTIFSTLIITGMTIVFTKKINLIYRLLLLLISISIISYSIYDSITPLIDQTIGDLSNPEYNRIKAFNYFILEFNKSWYSYFLGNGFASSNVSYGKFMNDLKDDGIYQSDIGLIGQWSMFGILSVYSIIKYLWVIIKDKSGALFTKLQAFHITIGFLMFLVLQNQQIVFILMFFYLYELTRTRAGRFNSFSRNANAT